MSNEEIKDMEHRILKAAERVFVGKGFVATTMSDIAKEVGISRTSMHYYFRTKDMLFDTILDELMNKLIPNLQHIIRQEGKLLQKLPQIIEHYNNIVRENQLFPLFLINEMHRSPEHLYQSIRKVAGRTDSLLEIRTYILQEMEEGTLKKMPLINILSTFMSLLIFPILVRKPMTQVLLDGKDELFEEFIEERKELILQVMTHLLSPE